MHNTKIEVQKMAKDLNRHTEKHDDEILKEKKRIVRDIVKTVTKTKKRKAVKTKKKKQQDSPPNEYMKKVIAKRKRNAEMIKGLKIKKLTTRRSPRRSTPKTKTVTKKKTTTRKPRVIFEDDKHCTYDHLEYDTGYKEESDRRYFKTGMDLHDTRCFDCRVLFAYEAVQGGCMPSSAQPVYFCEGRNKFGCKHGMCPGCHLKHTKSGDRRSRRKTNDT